MRIYVTVLCTILLLSLSSLSSAATVSEAVSTIATNFSDTLNKRSVQTVAVYDFSELNGYKSALGDFLAEEILTALVGQGQYRVIERRELDRILQEHGLYGKDLFDPTTIASLQKLAGIDAMVTGSMTRFGSNVRVNARILDIATATVVGAQNVTFERDEDVNALLGASSKSSGAGKSEVPDGLVAQPADVGFKGRYFLVTITAVRVFQGGRKVVVSGRFDFTANKSMRMIPEGKTDSVSAQTELGEIYGQGKGSHPNTLIGFGGDGALVQPNESFLVTWELYRGAEVQGSQLSIRSVFFVKDDGGKNLIETPIVINNIRLR